MDEFGLMIALTISNYDSSLSKERTRAVKMTLPQFYRKPVSLVTQSNIDLVYT